MKRVVAFLCALVVLLSACTNNTKNEENEQASQGGPSTESDMGSYSEEDTKKFPHIIDTPEHFLRAKSIELSLQEYANTPFLYDNEIIASNPENWILPGLARTVVYNIETEQEKELDIRSVDPKLDSNYYYYTNYGDSDGQTCIIKEDRINKKKENIYSVKSPNHKIGVKLSLLNSYIGFYEEILADDLSSVKSYQLKIIDTSGTILFTTDAILFSPFDSVILCDDNKIVYCEKWNEKYKLSVYDLSLQQIVATVEVPEVPIAYDYDGHLLGWSLHSGEMQIMNTITSQIDILDNNCGDIRIINARYIVYGKYLDVYVFDTKTRSIIYQASRYLEIDTTKTKRENLHFIVFFQVDKNNKTVVIQYEDWTIGKYKVLLLELIPK